jgi:regulator of RNase E activity RraA
MKGYNTMRIWNDDANMLAAMREILYSAVVGDILDQMGHTHQFLPARIQPLREDMVLVGRAMPVLSADTIDVNGRGVRNPVLGQPFGLMLDALDDLQQDEVYLCSGASPRYALWGELMSTRAKALGSAGAVLDGFSRDTKGILALGFPVFSHGRYAQDQAPRGKVIDFRVPVEIAGVHVEPGDILVGDCDGVVVVPRAIEQEVIQLACDKVHSENLVRQAIGEGMASKEAFLKYGVL